MLTLETRWLRVEVAPERGAEIRWVGRPSGENVLAWYDWASPVPASASTTYGTPDLDWLSEYRGGWQELFPNSGDGCTIDGVPLPFHGELSASEWQVVDSSSAALTLKAGTRLPLVVERKMRLAGDGPVLLIEETVVNEGQAPVSFVWGHHPAFDAVPGLRIDLPPGALHDAADLDTRRDWPDDQLVEVASAAESLHYLPDRPEAWAALRDPRSGRGVAIAWDLAAFPHLWLWREIGGTGFPWYGRARIVALEPQAAWPRDGLTGAVARGQSLELEAGARRETWLTLSLFEASDRRVTGVDRDGRVRQESSSDPASTGNATPVT